MVALENKGLWWEISLVAPRQEDDFKSYIQGLNKLLEQESFICLMISDGSSHFDHEQKKELNVWFKKNKSELKKRCQGFCRVVSQQSLTSKLSSKALQLALGVPYFVTTKKEQADQWLLQREIRGTDLKKKNEAL